MASEHKVEVLFNLPPDEPWRPRNHHRPFVWCQVETSKLAVGNIYRLIPAVAAFTVTAKPFKSGKQWVIPSEPFSFATYRLGES